MKMSENDHTNSLDPDQDQQKRLAGPEGEMSVRFKRLGPKKTLLSNQRVKTKTLLYLEHDGTCWVYDVTYDHFCSLPQAKVILFTHCTFS